ncbi:DUF5362 family protein [Chitinophaga sp. 22620]|uniref:DUF5362 family protein n=1 Tax=Chitinophaga sp. 22620 TaxID=3453952 RepID=UPI003F85FDDD
MENSNLFDLNVDAEISGYLSETARWGKFLAIVGFIGCGFMFLFAMFFSLAPAQSPYMAQMGDMYGTGAAASRSFLVIFYILTGILYIVPCVYLLRFSNRIKLALNSSDQAVMNTAFQSLKSLFKFMGVITIIGLAFVVLMFVGSLIIGIFYLNQ